MTTRTSPAAPDGDVRRRQLRDAEPDAIYNRAVLALDAGEMGAFEWNAATDDLTGDENFRELWGLPATGALTGETVFALTHPEDVESLRAAVGHAMETEEDYKSEFRIVLPDGAVRWLGARGRVTGRDASGAPVVLTGLNWDISDAKAQAEGFERLAREMNHRVNNAFAVIGSLVTLGSRTATDVCSFAEMMRAQIHALADAHRLAADHALHDAERSTDVDVATLVETALTAWTKALGPDRVAIRVAPGIALPARHVSGMAMLLYELATNAAKYGALGEVGGTLEVTVEAMGGDVARFSWRETLDGPRPARAASAPDEDGLTPMPSSSGFGTVLMQHCMSLLGASLDERTVGEDGFQVVFSFPYKAKAGAGSRV